MGIPPKSDLMRYLNRVRVSLVLVGMLWTAVVLLTSAHTTRAAPTPRPSQTPPARTSPRVAMDWLRVAGEQIVDAGVRRVTLRGFVVPVHNADGTPLTLSQPDYIRMRLMGANCQFVTVGFASVGLAPGVKPDPTTLKRLHEMVMLARNAGVYTVIGFSGHDLPEGTAGAFWQAFWLNQAQVQDMVLNLWKRLWIVFRDEPAVLGYLLLQDPGIGKLGLTESEFTGRHIVPFYQKAIDELRKFDQQHLVFFAPFTRSRYREYAPWQVPIGRDQCVYAPAYYPNLDGFLKKVNYQPVGYDVVMRRYQQEAHQLGVPLLIAGYGMPWNPQHDGDENWTKPFADLERFVARQLEVSDLSAVRPWFADDRAGITLGTYSLTWSLVAGKAGTAGKERRFITDVFVRPRPVRLSGDQPLYGYDAQNRRFVLRYVTRPGVTEIFVPKLRHFPEGFGVGDGSGMVLLCDPSSPRGLRPADPSRAAGAERFQWREADQTLLIQENDVGVRATIGIFPPPKAQP